MNDLAANASPSSAESFRSGPTYVPPTDIVETQNAVIMLLDMPGADPDSLDVTLDRRELTVFARSQSTIPEGYRLLHAEYRDGNYERRFIVSDQVDGDRIDAVLRDGVLRLTLPKTTPSPARKISVKSA